MGKQRASAQARRGGPPRQPCRPQGGPLALSGLQAAPRQRSSLVGGGTALHRGPELSLPGSRPLPAVSSTVGQTRTRVFSRSAVPSFSLQAVLAAELSRTAASLPPAHRLGAPPMGAPPPHGRPAPRPRWAGDSAGRPLLPASSPSPREGALAQPMSVAVVRPSATGTVCHPRSGPHACRPFPRGTAAQQSCHRRERPGA